MTALPLSRFYFNKVQGRHHSWCDECRLRYQRSKQLQRLYGITIEQYEQMAQDQGGKCLICRETPVRVKNSPLYVDHCHKTGRVRGLLCNPCNSFVGYVECFPERLDRIAAHILPRV